MNSQNSVNNSRQENHSGISCPITYRTLDESILHPALFASFNRYQEVTHCWRKEDNRRVLKEVAYTETWSGEQIELITKSLRNTLRGGGCVWGAFAEESLVGFASLENEFFGIGARYLQLSYLHVSCEKRGFGIGKAMFHLVCREARKRGAEKLYISAHSSRESIAFYQSVKCREARECNSALAAAEPFDSQLEVELAEEIQSDPFPGKGARRFWRGRR